MAVAVVWEAVADCRAEELLEECTDVQPECVGFLGLVFALLFDVDKPLLTGCHPGLNAGKRLFCLDGLTQLNQLDLTLWSRL